MSKRSNQFIRTEKQMKVMSRIDDLISTFFERSQELDEKGEFPFQNIEELKQIGYQKLSVPKEYGGDEISLYDFTLFQERLAQGDGSTALSIGWHVGIMMDLTTKRPWNEELFEKVCKDVVNGALLNGAASEPKTGSPTRGGRPETTAIKSQNQWIISGQKTFITMSPMLDYFLVTASIAHTDDIGQFLIPREVKGVSIDETWDSVAMRGTGSHDVVLDHVHIPQEYLVEIKSTNKKQQASGWLLHIPACYLGIAIAARDYAVKFSAEYSPNSITGTISELPNIQRLIGEMELELLSARHLLYSVARKWDESPSDRENLVAELGAAKMVATNTALSVVDKAMRITGARSLFKSNPLQRYYRDVRAGLHNPPMDDAVLTILSKRAIKGILS